MATSSQDQPTTVNTPQNQVRTSKGRLWLRLLIAFMTLGLMMLDACGQVFWSKRDRYSRGESGLWSQISRFPFPFLLPTGTAQICQACCV
jgi:hypothetical protein